MGNAAFTGDTLFMPDGGSARCDFPGGSAEELYDSIMKVLALPDDYAFVHVPRLRAQRARYSVGNDCGR
jgi:glyoxylase-like metal-dependent hydrolase (beta-lactamase superfamily II)